MPALRKNRYLLFWTSLFLLCSLTSIPLAAQDTSRGLSVAAQAIVGSEQIGQQYAVFIAIDRYKEWPPLKNAVSDAERVRNVLENRYYIDKVYTLYNEQATRDRVMRLFESLANELNPEDSLFLFYAGHGYIDPLTSIGSWILQDGSSNRYSPQGWLDNPSIRNILRRLKSRHVLLVSDSCFSGDILNMERGSQITINDEYFKKAYARRSRQVLTSGASETVPDESVFTRTFARLLEENTRPYVDPLMLFNDIRLTRDLSTSPLLGTLKDTDSQEGGSFIFFLKQAQPKFRIVYNPNGATGGYPPIDRNEYQPGSYVLLQDPGLLAREGYEFAGWNTQPDGSGSQYSVGTVLPIKESDIVLYARWMPTTTFKVIYNANGATKGSVPTDSRSYKSGNIAIVQGPGNLEKDGYTFAGWNSRYDGAGNQYFQGTAITISQSDVILYARWVPVTTYRITYYSNGATAGSAPVDQKNYTMAEKVTISSAGSLKKEGYEFIGWNTNKNGYGSSYKPGETLYIYNNIELYAQWKELAVVKSGWIDFSEVPPNCDIYLDGEYLRSVSEYYKSTSWESVKPGTHRVEVVLRYPASLHAGFYEMLEVNAGKDSKPKESLRQLANYLEERKTEAKKYIDTTKSRNSKLMLGLAGFGAGALCFFLGQSAYDQYKSATDPSTISTFRSQAEFFSGATIASLAIGAFLTIQVPGIKIPPAPQTDGIPIEQYIKDIDAMIEQLRSNL